MNRYFGDFGDVWKHLALGEVLVVESPTTYRESHAGSASYTFQPSLERELGIAHFYDTMSQAPEVIRASEYARVVRALNARNLTICPGSPLIAMSVLREARTMFLFHDIDAASLRQVAAVAAAFGVADRVRCVLGDGPRALVEAAPMDESTQTLTFIDPYRPFEDRSLGRRPRQPWESSSGAGITPMDLFQRLALCGQKTLLWYGFSDANERDLCLAGIDRTRDARSAVWVGELSLDHWNTDKARSEFQLTGCGLACANLRTASHDRLSDAGLALATQYAMASDSGTMRSLSFHELKA